MRERERERERDIVGNQLYLDLADISGSYKFSSVGFSSSYACDNDKVNMSIIYKMINRVTV